jgi:RNA polymerase sigma factor (sigma-70 family)
MATRQSGIVLERIQTLFEEGRIETMTDGQLLQRFAAHRAEAERAAEAAGLAFEVLVLRHGPMVLGVCRRVLRDPHDVEDAFQATFLILARRAGSVRKPDVVGGWLRKVAYRVATRARALSNRRAALERRMPDSTVDDPGTIVERDELCTAVLDEIQLLPEKYRRAVQLCYLEGQTHDEAATRLAWPVGTVRTRLGWARQRLRARMAARDLVLPAGFIGGSLVFSKASAEVPATLVKATVAAATGRVAGAVASSLATSALRAMLMFKLKLAFLFVMAAGSLAGLVAPICAGVGFAPTTAGVFGVQADDPRPDEPEAERSKRVDRVGSDDVELLQRAEPQAEPSKQPVIEREVRTVFFRVVDRSTKQLLAGVTLSTWIDGKVVREQVTDASGRLVIPLPQVKFDHLTVTARKEGLAPMKVHLWRSAVPALEVPRSFTLTMDRATSVGGIVRDEDGHPIEGVSVTPYVTGPADRAPESLDLGDAVARTDPEGRWHIDVIPVNFDLGRLRFRCAHPEFLGQGETSIIQPIPTPAQLRSQSGETVLYRGISVTGRIMNSQGRPIAGASVRLGDRFWNPATKTDADGRFRFRNAAAAETFLTAQAAGHTPEARSVRVRDGLAPIEFRLGPGRTIRGRVVDPQGRPLAKSFVTVSRWDGPRTLDRIPLTDEKGRFVWDGAPSARFSLAISKEEYRETETTIEPSDKEPVITLMPASLLRISGNVTDAETGEPIETFTVVPASQVEGPPLWLVDFAKTQHGGRYDCSFEVMGTLANRVRIEAKNYLPAMTPVFRGNEGVQTVDLRLKKGKWLEGVIRGPDGVPLAGAEVILVTGLGIYIEGRKAPRNDYHPHVLTGPDGSFSFSPPDGPFRIIAFHDIGYAEANAHQLAELRGLSVKPWGRIEGTLRVGGRLMPHETVVAAVNDEQIDPGKLAIQRENRGQTDEQGRFFIDRVAPGEARVYWLSDYSGTRFYQPAFVGVVPGQTARVDLIEEGGRALVGRVAAIDERGRQLELGRTSALLSLKMPDIPYPPDMASRDRPKWLSEWSRTPDAAEYRHYRRTFARTLNLQSNGSFRIDEVQPGAYTLRVHANGLTDLTFDVTVDAAAAGERREAIDVGTLTMKRPVTSETGR